VAGAEDPQALKTEELVAMLREVRERVRAQYPQTSAGVPGVALPDLMPLVHARDAAQAKVAAIGSVNPRAGGLLNGLIQGAKKLVARALDWHVREQVEFNRNAMGCVEAAIEALNETNRALVELGSRMSILSARQQEIQDMLNARQQEFQDLSSHWVAWREEWERKLSVNEIQFLRSVADLQGAFQHRVTLMESNFRELMQAQHRDFEGALERGAIEVQKRLWADLEQIRIEYERLIHNELRVIRQRAAAARPVETALPAAAGAAAELRFDYGRFAERFRGSAEYVREKQRFYLAFFTGRQAVLDIGCGRGEFLELMREAGVEARGIDLSRESVEQCRARGLEAEEADLFAYLASLPEASLDGIFCAQVVEHLPPERLPEMVRLAASRLSRGGVLAIETPNPECLAIFAVHFYLDPTHTRPVPHPLLAFYMEECGLGRIEVHKLSPAAESMPALASLPADFREGFFGGLDYAILGRKL